MHAYIPGKTKRHEEDVFDWIKNDATIPSGTAWLFGLEFIRDGFYWEAHEVLEAVWLASLPNSPEKILTQALIQWANAGLKFRMGRQKAAQRLMDIADGHYSDFKFRNDQANSVLSALDIEQIRSSIWSKEIEI